MNAPLRTLAVDRDSVRSFDKDGRLHVAVARISKATVNPYWGREIPDNEQLGLDPNERYQLLRDPNELRRAASSFNNLPLLSRHTPVDARDHHPELVVGSTGTDAKFEDPYLTNSLVVWAKDAIDAIESGERQEISCAYRYRCDLTPGTYRGQSYSGVIRSLVGNHVAIVPEGRVGSDVVVGDARERDMTEIMIDARSRLTHDEYVDFAVDMAMGRTPRERMAKDARTPRRWEPASDYLEAFPMNRGVNLNEY